MRWSTPAFPTPASTCWRWTRIRGWAGRCWPGARDTTQGWFPPTMPLRRCTRWRSSGLARAGLAQYEISNFCRAGIRIAAQSPLLGAAALSGPGAGCLIDAAGYGEPGIRRATAVPVLRWTTTDDLGAFLRGADPVEVERLSPARQHEEAWFLGLRLNEGVEPAELEREFGRSMVAPALGAARRLHEDGLLAFEGRRARLTAVGRLLSNEVFQEFLELERRLQSSL